MAYEATHPHLYRRWPFGLGAWPHARVRVRRPVFSCARMRTRRSSHINAEPRRFHGLREARRIACPNREAVASGANQAQRPQKAPDGGDDEECYDKCKLRRLLHGVVKIKQITGGGASTAALRRVRRSRSSLREVGGAPSGTRPLVCSPEGGQLHQVRFGAPAAQGLRGGGAARKRRAPQSGPEAPGCGHSKNEGIRGLRRELSCSTLHACRLSA